MPKNLDTLKTAASAEVEGVEIPASHDEKTYNLIEQAKAEKADWSVQWGAKPETDGRAEEMAYRQRELNDALIKPYVQPERFIDEKNRVRNLMHISDFCRKLDRILGPAYDGGSRIFINTPPSVAGFDNEKMKGLFIKMRGMDTFTFHVDLPAGWKKICAIQTPRMSEWGIMNLDDRGAFKSWKYIGWRGQVLLRLILAGAITKKEAHEEFGEPFVGDGVDDEYFRKLEEFERNAKRDAN